MSLRELERVARTHQERERAEHERHMVGLAVQTAELVNMIGGAAAGKKWTRVDAADYFRAWTGKGRPRMTLEEYRRREASVEQAIAERRQREKRSF